MVLANYFSDALFKTVMGDDFFYGWAKTVCPVGGVDRSGNIDPFFFRIRRDQFREKG